MKKKRIALIGTAAACTLLVAGSLLFVNSGKNEEIGGREENATTIDDNGIRQDYYYSEDNRGNGYIKDVFYDNPKLVEAVNPTKEEQKAFNRLMKNMDKHIVQVETRYVEDGEMVCKEDIREPENADCGYAYSLDVDSSEDFNDILQELLSSGFEVWSAEYADASGAGLEAPATESIHFDSDEEYLAFVNEHYDGYLSFMLALEDDSHEVKALATYIHLDSSDTGEYYYTDSEWNQYTYTDWLIINFNVGLEE